MSLQKVNQFFGEDISGETRSLAPRESTDCLLPKLYIPPSPTENLPDHQTDVIYSASLQTSKKLRQFFGDFDLAVVGIGSTKKLGEFYGVPIKSLKKQSSSETLALKEEFPLEDLSIDQLQKGGLKVMLQSVYPMIYFIAYLLQEHNAENCLFVLDLVELDQSEDWSMRAKEIYQCYFTSQGLLELNVTFKVKSKVYQSLESNDSSCFDGALDEIMVLLEQSFTGFKKSSLYSQMVHELGVFRTTRTKIDFNRTVAVLESHLPTIRDERTLFLRQKVQDLSKNWLSRLQSSL